MPCPVPPAPGALRNYFIDGTPGLPTTSLPLGHFQCRHQAACPVFGHSCRHSGLFQPWRGAAPAQAPLARRPLPGGDVSGTTHSWPSGAAGRLGSQVALLGPLPQAGSWGQTPILTPPALFSWPSVPILEWPRAKHLCPQTEEWRPRQREARTGPGCKAPQDPLWSRDPGRGAPREGICLCPEVIPWGPPTPRPTACPLPGRGLIFLGQAASKAGTLSHAACCSPAEVPGDPSSTPRSPLTPQWAYRLSPLGLA